MTRQWERLIAYVTNPMSGKEDVKFGKEGLSELIPMLLNSGAHGESIRAKKHPKFGIDNYSNPLRLRVLNGFESNGRWKDPRRYSEQFERELGGFMQSIMKEGLVNALGNEKAKHAFGLFQNWISQFKLDN